MNVRDCKCDRTMVSCLRRFLHFEVSFTRGLLYYGVRKYSIYGDDAETKWWNRDLGLCHDAENSFMVHHVLLES